MPEIGPMGSIRKRSWDGWQGLGMPESLDQSPLLSPLCLATSSRMFYKCLNVEKIG